MSAASQVRLFNLFDSKTRPRASASTGYPGAALTPIGQSIYNDLAAMSDSVLVVYVVPDRQRLISAMTHDDARYLLVQGKLVGIEDSVQSAMNTMTQIRRRDRLSILVGRIFSPLPLYWGQLQIDSSLLPMAWTARQGRATFHTSSSVGGRRLTEIGSASLGLLLHNVDFAFTGSDLVGQVAVGGLVGGASGGALFLAGYNLPIVAIGALGGAVGGGLVTAAIQKSAGTAAADSADDVSIITVVDVWPLGFEVDTTIPVFEISSDGSSSNDNVSASVASEPVPAGEHPLASEREGMLPPVAAEVVMTGIMSPSISLPPYPDDVTVINEEVGSSTGPPHVDLQAHGALFVNELHQYCHFSVTERTPDPLASTQSLRESATCDDAARCRLRKKRQGRFLRALTKHSGSASRLLTSISDIASVTAC